MGTKVVKFGGSSVADGIQLRKTKEIIESDPSRRYVVVSAPGKRFDGDNKITDLLYVCQQSMSLGLPYDQLLQVVVDRFTAMKANIGSTVDIDSEFDRIRDNLRKGCSADYVASRGECLNAMLVADFLGFDFVDTEGLVVFNEKGRLDAEATDRALAAELKHHEKAVLPGFYGTNPVGKVQTFTRGGSDITGALVAKAVGADVYENWTDVSGFLVADPRIVNHPRPIHHISYKELRELAYMGASVLHEDAIYPAKMANIPINIRNTNAPEDPGTLITAEPDPANTHVVTGIAGSKDFTVIALYKNMMSSERGYVRRILTILDDFDINFEHIPSGIDTVSVVVSNESLNGHLEELLAAFEKQLEPDHMEYHDDIALIATVGSGMSRRSGTSARLFTALAEADINIRMIDQGSSEMNIIVGVENRDFEKAIASIYNAFEQE